MGISYSAYSKYVLCPKMYDYHYNERLRPTGDSSALVFGRLVDEAVNAVLEGKEPTYDLEIPATVDLFKDDLDTEILDDNALSKITTEAKGAGYEGDDVFGMVNRLMQRYLDREELSPAQWSVLTIAVGLTMRRKAELMVQAYRNQVMPLIEKVHGVQVQVSNGIVDLVADVKGYGKVIIDNKTASRPYDKNAVLTSTQLAYYADELKCDVAGFIVMQKVLKKNRIKKCKSCGHDGTGGRHKTCDNTIEGKRCNGEWDEWINPEATIEIIIDNVPERSKVISVEAFKEAEKGVEACVFPRNLNQCKYVFGKKCPYFDKCWSNSDEGLEKK